jgi:hypothetical protein
MNKILIIGGKLVLAAVIGFAIEEGIFQIRKRMYYTKMKKCIMEITGAPRKDAENILRARDELEIKMVKAGATRKEVDAAIDQFYADAVDAYSTAEE